MSAVHRCASDDTLAVLIEDSSGWNPSRDAEPPSCDQLAHALAVSASATITDVRATCPTLASTFHPRTQSVIQRLPETERATRRVGPGVGKHKGSETRDLLDWAT